VFSADVAVDLPACSRPRSYLQAKDSFDPSLKSLLESRFAGIPYSVHPLQDLDVERKRLFPLGVKRTRQGSRSSAGPLLPYPRCRFGLTEHTAVSNIGWAMWSARASGHYFRIGGFFCSTWELWPSASHEFVVYFRGVNGLDVNSFWCSSSVG
jgi:hypothetical protein